MQKLPRPGSGIEHTQLGATGARYAGRPWVRCRRGVDIGPQTATVVDLDLPSMNRIHPVPITSGGTAMGVGGRFLAPLRLASADSGSGIAVDVSLCGGVYHVRADLPGVEHMAVVVSIDQDTVSIDAGCLPDAEPSHGPARPTAVLSRFFRLPVALDEKGARAVYGGGVLIIDLPLRDPLARPMCTLRSPGDAGASESERPFRRRPRWP